MNTVSDLGVGDSETATLTVSPADGTTLAVLEVRAPDGTTQTIPASGGDLEPIAGTSPQQYRQTWTADTPVVYDQAGRWVLAWTVTGTGEGTETLEQWVVANPTAGGPSWTPGRSRVAAYVPRRTLIRSTTALTGSKDEYLYDWDSTTAPTGLQVSRLIADGVAWVQARVHPMNTVSHEAAGVCAALYAAAMIERLHPDGDSSLQRANDLEKRLDVLIKDLAVSNQAANDEQDGTQDGFDVVYPVHSFPRADPRWNYPTYW